MAKNIWSDDAIPGIPHIQVENNFDRVEQSAIGIDVTKYITPQANDIIVKHELIIAGGFAAWAITGGVFEANDGSAINVKQPRDIDLFLPIFSISLYAKVVEELVSVGYDKISSNEIVTTLAAPEHTSLPVLQVISPRYLSNGQTFGSATQIIDSFDFTGCRAAVILEEDKVTGICDSDMWQDWKFRRLRIKTIHCPIGNTVRVLKYVKKGWHIPMSELSLLHLLAFIRSQNNPDYLNLLLDLHEIRTNVGRQDEDVVGGDAFEELVDRVYMGVLID